jgi:predicted transcriptional regulator
MDSSLYEQNVLKTYLVDIVKLPDSEKPLDVGVLKKEYVENGKSLRTLAKEFKRSRTTIRRKLVVLGIDTS